MADNGLKDELIVRVKNVRIFLDLRFICKHKMRKPQGIGDVDKGVVTLRLAGLSHGIAFKANAHYRSLLKVQGNFGVVFGLGA
jgi:hypothetical protein